MGNLSCVRPYAGCTHSPSHAKGEGTRGDVFASPPLAFVFHRREEGGSLLAKVGSRKREEEEKGGERCNYM